MSPTVVSCGFRKLRPGTCHRCGWRGSVAKILRGERRELRIDRSVRRMCIECTEELRQARSRSGSSAQLNGQSRPVV